MRRPRCPFYGFEWPDGTSKLRDTGDNRCALLWHAGSTACRLERAERAPDLNLCPVYDAVKHLIEAASTLIALYPAEHPEGINYTDWLREVQAPARASRSG